MNSAPNRRGLTLIEMLVVIAIIGLLMAMLLPAVQAVRESARRTSCMNKLKQLAIGVNSFESQMGWYPCNGGNGPQPTRPVTGADGRSFFSFFCEILAFVDELPSRDRLAPYIENPDNHPWGGPLVGVRLPLLQCPSEQLPQPDAETLGEPSNYRCSVGDFFQGWDNGDTWRKSCRGPFGYGPKWSNAAKVTDGLSNTVLLGEACVYPFRSSNPDPRAGVAVVSGIMVTAPPIACLQGAVSPSWNQNVVGGPGTRWLDARIVQIQTILPPNSTTCDGWLPTISSYHAFGAFVAMADGSVRFIDNTIDTGDLTKGLTGSPLYNPWLYRGPSRWGGVWGQMGSQRGQETIMQ